MMERMERQRMAEEAHEKFVSVSDLAQELGVDDLYSSYFDDDFVHSLSDENNVPPQDLEALKISQLPESSFSAFNSGSEDEDSRPPDIGHRRNIRPAKFHGVSKRPQHRRPMAQRICKFLNGSLLVSCVF